MQPAFRVENLSFRYGALPWLSRRDALHEVSVEGWPGEIHALVGANGAGKSTLIRHLVGLHPARGKLEVLGAPAGARSIRARVSYLPESSDTVSRMRVGEATALQAALYGFQGAELKERVATALTSVGMVDLSRRRLSELSRGQRRRVGLAQALVPRADFLILDEPFGGVDPFWCERLRDLLVTRAKDGVSVLLSSHLLLDIEETSDRLTVLEGGQVLVSGPTDEVLGETDEWLVRVRPAAGRTLDEDELRTRLEPLEGAAVEIHRPRRSLVSLLHARRREED